MLTSMTRSSSSKCSSMLYSGWTSSASSEAMFAPFAVLLLAHFGAGHMPWKALALSMSGMQPSSQWL